MTIWPILALPWLTAKGEIHSQCAVMVADFFRRGIPVYDRNASGLWAQSSVAKREAGYRAMLDSGARIMASVNAINRWLERSRADITRTNRL